MALLLFYLLLAILFSFLCSILEAVLLSITPSYILALEEKDPITGGRLRRLKDDVDRPLSAILSLNTIAHTIGAAGVGAQAAVVFREVSTVAISVVLTLLILVLSEIIPKTLGANYWKALTPFTVTMLRLIVPLMLPFVFVAKGITSLLTRREKEPSISRDEISAMADLGHQEGIFEESESRILKNLIRFKSIKTEDIMTPRTVVVAYPDNLSLKQVFQDENFPKFTRIPVYHKQKDHVLGFIHKHDVLDKLAKDQHKLPVKEVVRSLMVVGEETPLPRLFEMLLAEREQIALVTDPYGGMAGIVTMEDVMETLLGIEIMDEFDSTQDMQVLARTRWRQRAERLGLLTEELREEEEAREKTIQLGLTGGQPPAGESSAAHKDGNTSD
ncbi:Hemolysin, contains CBS domains [Catalinimonas alkaloidigena]|uniref:Hemolysin, contains CBS domains n=1 Tax=Catalinimonas alkaloidigena TaxID=1075417 RepID=A0A1G9N1U9_9BACT|nr:CNNM domain-containing protein [Catalinimonas alkaloidigena]SDL79825.1 Hemolysin, contains CBS domains [Catalinimonas alkaloidigena]